MAKVCHIGISNVARRVKKLYVGTDGKARKIKRAYIGVSDKARLFYRSGYGNCPDGLFALSATLADDNKNIQYLDASTYAIKSSIKGPILTSTYRSFAISGTSGKLLLGMYKGIKPISYYYENTYSIDFPTGASSEVSWSYKKSYTESINFGADNLLGTCLDTLIKRDPETCAVISEITLQNGTVAGSDARNGSVCGGDSNMCYSSGSYTISYTYAVINVNNLATGAYIRTCHCTGHVGTNTVTTSGDSLGSQIILEATRRDSDGKVNYNYFFTYDKNTGTQLTDSKLTDKNINLICTIK